jgi:DNA-binding Lrp family transcriptional regulator
MQLTPQDRRILGCAELQAYASLQVLASETGYRAHTVGYRLRRLQSAGLIQERPFIDSMKLGLIDVALYFSLAGEIATQRRSALKQLAQSSQVVWLASLAGSFQYVAVVVARSLPEVASQLERDGKKLLNLFAEKALVPRLQYWRFPRKYLAPQRRLDQGFSMQPLRVEQGAVVLDERDHRILAALTGERYRSRRELAAQIKLPLSTLERRLEKLEAAGVIGGYYWAFPDRLLGIQSLRILLSCRGWGAALCDPLLALCRKAERVTRLLRTLGSWDFEIVLEINSNADLVEFTDALYTNFGHEIAHLQVLQHVEDITLNLFPARKSGPS